MTQLPLFDITPADKVVNVASVPLRSPFRYPGGKTWLVPRIRQWLCQLQQRPCAHLIEPFAGGAIVGLTAAFEQLALHVTLVELDSAVGSVWETIISDAGGAEWLAQQIVNFKLTRESVLTALSTPPATTRELAFQTLLKNRVYHGGILAPGSAPIKHGENGKGIGSRWYPQTLRRRILDIASIRDRLTFILGDGFDVIAAHSRNPNVAFFIDPPYTGGRKRAGARLYTHYQLDHAKLFEIVSGLAGEFLITYDDAPEIRALAQRHGLDMETVPMTNTHHATMMELLIARDLSWLRLYRHT